MTEIEIVKKDDFQAGTSTPGILREVAFKTENLLFARATTVNGGAPSVLASPCTTRRIRLHGLWKDKV